MNRYFSSLFLLLYGGLCCGCVGAEFPEVEKARQRGAQSKICFHVTDSSGNPIHDVRMQAYYSSSDAHLNDDSVDQLSDTNGLITAEGRTVGDMTYTLSKEGYYDTVGRHWFYRNREDCVRNGRWQPWNSTNTVIIKERRNPTSMYSMNVDATIPIRDKPAGYDLEVGDWISPYGKGKVPDLWITYSADISDILTFSNRLVIAGNNQGDGFQRNEKEAWSSLVSSYEAPLDGYLPEVVLSVERTKNQIIKRELLGESEYLFVRSRTTLDKDGNISSARYSKIYGPIEYGDDEKGGGIVRFIYFMNPTPNGRNMEFDPDRNLLSGHGNTHVTMP